MHIEPRSNPRRIVRRVRVFPLLVVALAAGCGGSSDPHLTAVFDGARCDIDGPDRVKAGDIKISFANDSDDAAGLAVLSVPTGMDVDPGVGVDGPIASPEPERGTEIVGVIELDAADNASELAALTPGTHVLDCVTYGPNGPRHFWRGAILDVSQ
jgi:hypothetical protein